MVTMTERARKRANRNQRPVRQSRQNRQSHARRQQPGDQSDFDYSSLSSGDAKRLQQAGERVRDLTKRTLDVVVKIGLELICAKEILGHGKFSRWLQAEFAWKPRMARNFMSAAQRFKTASLADLNIVPTAAYMLAAPSTPEAACEEAIRRAENGESITVPVAREIVARIRKATKPQEISGRGAPSGMLVNILERFRARWPKEDLRSYAEELRRYAESLLAELDEPNV